MNERRIPANRQEHALQRTDAAEVNMMDEPKIARIYECTAIALSEYIRSYVPKGWSRSIRNGNLVTNLSAKETKALLDAHTDNESLERVIYDIDKKKPLSGFKKEYIRKAIDNFFQSGEYKKSEEVSQVCLG